LEKIKGSQGLTRVFMMIFSVFRKPDDDSSTIIVDSVRTCVAANNHTVCETHSDLPKSHVRNSWANCS